MDTTQLSPCSKPAMFEWWYTALIDGQRKRVGIVYATSIAEANRLAAEKFAAFENVIMDCGWRCTENEFPHE